MIFGTTCGGNRYFTDGTTSLNANFAFLVSVLVRRAVPKKPVWSNPDLDCPYRQCIQLCAKKAGPES